MSLLENSECVHIYEAARKMALKEYHRRVSMGNWGILPTLDGLLENVEIASRVELGIVEIPLKKIVGTSTNARSNSFAHNFMPLLEKNTEFGGKWISLCYSHLKEGITDPIKVFEYMNWFFVIEGNKRVSVLKYFGAYSFHGSVTRLVPKWDEYNDAIRRYYAFMEFYKKTAINSIWFSHENSFDRLYQHIISLKLDTEKYDSKYISFMKYLYAPFRDMYYKLEGNKFKLTTGDAYLEFVRFFGRPDSYSDNELENKIRQLIPEIKHWENDEINVAQSEPVFNEEGTIVSGLKTVVKKVKTKKLKVAFVYAKTCEESKWTYSHEQGRKYAEKALNGQIITSYAYNVPESMEAYSYIKKLAEEGNNVIFTTSPDFFDATLRAAMEYKKVKFFNCSIMHSYKHVRTYFGRIFEPVFIAGLIAGIVTKTDIIGYVGTFRTPEVVSVINSFTLGAKMVNPQVKVIVEWIYKWDVHDLDILAGTKLIQNGADIVSQHNIYSYGNEGAQSGIYTMECSEDKKICVPKDYIATPIWNWGTFYHKILNDILDELPISNKVGLGNSKLVNYWWGLESGIVDFQYSKGTLNIQTQKLVEHFKKMISERLFHPFQGPVYDNAGNIRIEEGKTPDYIDFLSMDWFVDGVKELDSSN